MFEDKSIEDLKLYLCILIGYNFYDQLTELIVQVKKELDGRKNVYKANWQMEGL
jgi:hypothetical protein